MIKVTAGNHSCKMPTKTRYSTTDIPYRTIKHKLKEYIKCLQSYQHLMPLMLHAEVTIKTAATAAAATEIFQT
jgi:hypothetical protein